MTGRTIPPRDPNSLRQRMVRSIQASPNQTQQQILRTFIDLGYPRDSITGTLCWLRTEGRVIRENGRHTVTSQPEPSVRERPCITGCGRTVRSQHAGHRMCDHCRNTAWDESPLYGFNSTGRQVRHGGAS